MSLPMEQPFDIREPIRSESVMLAGGPRDAQLSVRLCRYPSVGVAWVWAHLWLPDRSLNYNVDYHRCSEVAVDVDGPDSAYEATDIVCRLQRSGPRASMSGAELDCTLALHDNAHPPNAPGTVSVHIGARFTPGRMSGAMYAGSRQEVRGTIDATVNVEGRDIPIQGHGHWHEQLQDAPRWIWPFTYVSLSGDELSLVCTRGPRRASGVAQRKDEQLEPVDLQIDPPGAERRLRIAFDDTSSIEGTARVVHENSVHIYGKRRRGTYVQLENGLEGTINDWEGMQ